MKKVAVFSFDRRELKVVTKALRQGLAGDNCEVLARPLARSKLKGLCLDDGPEGGPPRYDLCIVVHYNEGRALLLDRDGLYNDFIHEAFRVSRGNVFVVLSNANTENETALASPRVVSALSDGGGQQSVMAFHGSRRFLTWLKTPTDYQLSHFRLALEGGVATLGAIPEGVRLHSVAAARQQQRQLFCVLL